MFSTQMIVDADYSPTDGWEIVFRFDPDSMEAAYSGLTDDELLQHPIGKVLATSFIGARNAEGA